jgi:hypothetical protein
MGRSQLRLGVWALAILSSLAVAGVHTAYASDNQPRLEAAGWFFIFNCAAPNCSAETKFGVTGKDENGNKFGRFEYFNTVTGLKVHGKLTTLSFKDNTCNTPPPEFGGPPAGSPAATLSGLCDEGGANCQFQMDLVDGGDRKGGDWVCNVQVSGYDKNNVARSDMDINANQVVRGNIKIRNY